MHLQQQQLLHNFPEKKKNKNIKKAIKASITIKTVKNILKPNLP